MAYSESLESYIIWFAIYSFIGWIYESSLRTITNRRLINSGFLNGPYIPIYGFGAVIDIFLLGSWKNPLWIFLVSGVINCLLEYAVGSGMEALFHSRWWDYSHMKFNINGHVCLLGFLAFGAFATVVILYFHPWLMAHTTDLLNLETQCFIAIVIVSVMLIDCYITVISMADFEEKYTKLVMAVEDIHREIDQKHVVHKEAVLERLTLLKKGMNYQHKRLMAAFPKMTFHANPISIKELNERIRQISETIRNRD